MDQSENVAFALRTIAERSPGTPAMLFPETTFTFEQVWQLVEAFAFRMRAAGVTQGTAVILETHEQEIMLAAMFATAALGAVFVQNPGDIDVSGVLDGPLHRFYVPEDGDATPAGSTVIDGSWSPAELRGTAFAAEPLAGYSAPDARWIVAQSSGTTGYPKLMEFSQRIMLDRSRAVSNTYIPGKTVLCSLFPSFSRPFVSRTFGALLNGCSIVIGRDPAFWQTAGVTMLSASPIQARALLSDVDMKPKLPVIEVPGSRVDPELSETLFRNFNEIHNVYGAGETNKSYTNVMSLADNGMIHVEGRPEKGILEIVDATGLACPPGAIGQVRIRNDYMVNGYLNDSEAEEKAFKDNWFYPGDLGRWGENAVLEIVRREDDVVNIGGFKAHAFAVDRIIRDIDGVADAVVFKSPKSNSKDELFAFVVLEPGSSRLQIVASARHLIERRFGPELVPRLFREVAGIPRRPDGSPDRQACEDLVLQLTASK